MQIELMHCSGRKGYADIGFVELNMDWTTPLRSQQADFIQRVKSGHLLHCEAEGQHSELTVISGEKLKQLRKFCWQMAEKYKRTSPVYDVFINNLKGKLGEEVFKARLANLITEVDYEKRQRGDDKVDFRLASDPSIGIQVKARHGSIDTVRWSISSEEVDKNAVLICVLIQEEVNEAQAEYHLILAGFLPTQQIKESGKFSFKIDKLLYSGGLQSYLEYLQFREPIKQVTQTNSIQDIFTKPSPTITIGSWKYKIPLEELIILETALKDLREKQQNASSDVETPQEQIRQQFPTIEEIWQEVLAHLQQPAFFRHHGKLLSFDGKVACIGIYSLPLLKLAQQMMPNIAAAFEEVFKSKIKVSLQRLNYSNTTSS
jgi:hypothetical protein